MLLMVCLLRYNNALNICWNSIKTETNTAVDTFIEFHLLVHKTHQNGGVHCSDDTLEIWLLTELLDISSFVLYANKSKLWMCLITTVAQWWLAG